MQTNIDFAVLLFVLAMTVFKAKSTQFSPVNCGNVTILTAAHGVIQTPNFPKAFRVPIRCRWVINKTAIASQLEADNQTVEVNVYLTQLYVTTGLTITEYHVYDEESNTAYTGNIQLNLSTTDVIDKGVMYVSTVNYPFMVIDFTLDVLEGNHLRVLDKWLDVYGFNITYEISTIPRNDTDICSVSLCNFLGDCYADADFSTYQCSCFDDYNGKDCADGPFCHQKEEFCANGGTCKYVGTLVLCLCTEGFDGPRCDRPIPNSTAIDFISNTSQGVECEFDEKTHQKQLPCSNCRDLRPLSDVKDRAHYFLDIHLVSTQSSPVENVSRLVRREIERKFIDQKLNSTPLTLLNNFTDANLIRTERYHFYANSSAENVIKDSVHSVFKNHAWNNTFTLQKGPSLHLLKVSSNTYDKGIWEDEEFILSCVAQGSPSMSFQWYKDNVPINVTLAVRGMWLKVVPDENNTYRSLLVVERAEEYDSGIYTCQVKDWGLQQCNSTGITIRKIPRVRMQPLNIVTSRGSNEKIICLSEKEFGDENGKVGYMWMQDGEPLITEIPYLYYEDLYLGGSMLRINNIQKSGRFGCNVGKATASVRVDILDKEQTPFCQEDGTWNVTGAGMTALQECPENYAYDVVSRLCSMVDAKKAEWDVPDYSKCVSESFLAITRNFHRLTLGYQNDAITMTSTLNAVYQWLSSLPPPKLLHGEGESIVKFLQIVCDFSLKTKKWLDFRNASIYFYKIVDVILPNPTSILNREEVFKLSALIEKWTSLLKSVNRDLFNSTFSSFEYHLQLPFGQSVTLPPNISIKVDGSTHPKESAQVTIMMYKNLSVKLLPNYGLLQLKNGEQIYELSSPIVHVLMSNSPKRENSSANWFVIDVKFKLPFHRSVCCGVVSSFGQSWNLDMCVRQSMVSPKEIQCSCNHSGMFALFTADLRMLDSDVYRKYHLVVMIGCAFCFLLCIISLCVLLFRWLTTRSCLMYLKIQICASTAAAMLLFLYGSCDPSSDAFAYIFSGLQMFLFISVSSHISILTVMYIDVISLKSIPNMKVSAISVMTVSPMLLIVFTPFSRQITNEQLSSWWLCKRTLLLYIHIILGLFFLLLFIVLYYSVMKKLLFLWKSPKVERRIIVQRISFLQYTLAIFATTAVMVISSTVYVNVKSFTSQCVFGSSCALLGFVIFVCYFPQNEVSFCFRIMFPSLKHSDTKYSPELQVCPSHSALRATEISETESASHSSQSMENTGNIHSLVENGQNSSPEPNKFENNRDLNSIPETDDEPSGDGHQDEQPEPVLQESSVPPDKETKLEPDLLWPVTKNNYISTSGCPQGAECCSPLRAKRPEMLTTRVCVELGVLKNSDSVSIGLSDGSPSTVVICSVDVEPCPGHIVELNEVKFTTNAIGPLCSESVAQKVADPIGGATTLETKADKTDVLDRISQDLDYLLNRSPSPPSKVRRARALFGSPKMPRNSINKSAKSKM